MSGSTRSTPVWLQLSSSSPSLGMTDKSMENEDQQLKSAVSTGRTSYLPLITLPKKKVEFNPTKSVIRPLSIHDETWINLKREIVRRRSLSDCASTAVVIVPPPPQMIQASSNAERPNNRMARFKRRVKKILTRLRNVFARHHSHQPHREENVVVALRRDSRPNNLSRLAAKRKRLSLIDHEALEEPYKNDQLIVQPDDTVTLLEDQIHQQITSELLDIFQTLTLNTNNMKRPRLATR